MSKEIAKRPAAVQIPQEAQLQRGFSKAFQLVDDVVLKNYITKLPSLQVVPLQDHELANIVGKIRLFKITEMVYEQDESATYKFASVFNTVAATSSAMVLVIDSDGSKTDFYLGIRSMSDQNSTQTAYTTLVNAMRGQFPGTQMKNLKTGEITQLLESIETSSISSVSCIANNKNRDFVENRVYLQGLEKMALAMQGNRYTAVIIATPTSQEQLNLVRQGYENIYTQLSPYASTVVNYGTNTSISNGETQQESKNSSETAGTTKTATRSEANTSNIGEVVSESKAALSSKVGSTIGATLSVAGAVIGSVIPVAGTAAGAAIGGAVGGTIGGLVGSTIAAATNKTVSTTQGGGSQSITDSTSEAESLSTTKGTSSSLAYTLSLATGESSNLQLTIQNKPLISMLDRIDKQLERLSEFESVGMWECAAYFLGGGSAVTKVAAATYKALMSGENSGLEVSAINTWDKPQRAASDAGSQTEQIAKYVCNFMHPVFSYSANGTSIPVTPTNLVSGNELAIHMGLPRHSVAGFPVIEHADFGKEVVRYDCDQANDNVQLGKVFNMGREVPESKVYLDVDSLAMHTLVVGATGSGKSNTVYTLLDKLTATHRRNCTFMVIEPAKGEYKNVFGHRRNVSVFGTNPAFTKLLKINPFKFPAGVHVLEHIDRLVEIFNVCWPMYAAMPAVLKDAVLASYSSCGWDLTLSKNSIADNLFPTFQDLLDQLERVISESAYSEEVKSNYAGSLITRVRSLTNGLNGQIFSSNEIDNSVLFDSNVIVDISRIGSQETKALIMGILVIRLSEHRMSNSTGSNSKLKHITVLEEAHNILGASHQDSNVEGASISGKSVEMIANAIAEMRTYGEGFIIADQSPGAVDISAIRNTNTKIIMRLPEESDRRAAGKSAALNDSQIDEIARLPKGTAVVYQNDWIEPVLCKIDKFTGEEIPFREPSFEDDFSESKQAASTLVNFVAHSRLDNPDRIDIRAVSQAIEFCDCSVSVKSSLYSLVQEYRTQSKLHIWDEKLFASQSQIITEMLGLSSAVDSARRSAFDINGFSYRLNTLIAQKLDFISDDLLLAISQCVIKTYSETHADGREFYKNWVESRGKIL